jgi:hypothetical protein
MSSAASIAPEPSESISSKQVLSCAFCSSVSLGRVVYMQAHTLMLFSGQVSLAMQKNNSNNKNNKKTSVYAISVTERQCAPRGC